MVQHDLRSLDEGCPQATVRHNRGHASVRRHPMAILRMRGRLCPRPCCCCAHHHCHCHPSIDSCSRLPAEVSGGKHDALYTVPGPWHVLCNFSGAVLTHQSVQVGDWGRHGLFNQSLVAQAMGRVAQNLDFVISVGDNFYESGIVAVKDAQFDTSFADVYTAQSLQVTQLHDKSASFHVVSWRQPTESACSVSGSMACRPWKSWYSLFTCTVRYF